MGWRWLKMALDGFRWLYILFYFYFIFPGFLALDALDVRLDQISKNPGRRDRRNNRLHAELRCKGERSALTRCTTHARSSTLTLRMNRWSPESTGAARQLKVAPLKSKSNLLDLLDLTTQISEGGTPVGGRRR